MRRLTINTMPPTGNQLAIKTLRWFLAKGVKVEVWLDWLNDGEQVPLRRVRDVRRVKDELEFKLMPNDAHGYLWQSATTDDVFVNGRKWQVPTQRR